MSNKQKVNRPPYEEIHSSAAFQRWYWLKSELVELCKHMGLPIYGSKFELRDRIIYAFEHNGKVKPKEKVKKKSKFNWAKESLNLETKITDSITFGPNLRRFFKTHIGTEFSFNIAAS